MKLLLVYRSCSLHVTILLLKTLAFAEVGVLWCVKVAVVVDRLCTWSPTASSQ